MSRRALAELQALCGDLDNTNALAALNRRSSRHGQKNRLAVDSEGELQVRFVAWLRKMGLPVHSIPNEGRRGMMMTMRMRRLGLWPGASDLFLARPASGHAGFYIELKARGERPRPNQQDFMQCMRNEGYRAEWFDDLGKAQAAVIEYLSNGGKKNATSERKGREDAEGF